MRRVCVLMPVLHSAVLLLGTLSGMQARPCARLQCSQPYVTVPHAKPTTHTHPSRLTAGGAPSSPWPGPGSGGACHQW